MIFIGKTSEVLFEKTSEVLETSEVSLETSEVSIVSDRVADIGSPLAVRPLGTPGGIVWKSAPNCKGAGAYRRSGVKMSRMISATVCFR